MDNGQITDAVARVERVAAAFYNNSVFPNKVEWLCTSMHVRGLYRTLAERAIEEERRSIERIKDELRNVLSGN